MHPRNETRRDHEESTTKCIGPLGCFRNVSEEYYSSISRQFPYSTDNLIFEWLLRSVSTSGDLLLLDAWTSSQQLTEPAFSQLDLSRLGEASRMAKQVSPKTKPFVLELSGIDIKPLFTKSGPDTMKYLFQTVERVDQLSLSLRMGQGLRRMDGPLPFLRPERHPREPGRHGRMFWAEPCKEGLIVEFDGFLLPDQTMVGNAFTVVLEGRCICKCRRQLSRIEIWLLIHKLRLTDLEDCTSQVLRPWPV